MYTGGGLLVAVVTVVVSVAELTERVGVSVAVAVVIKVLLLLLMLFLVCRDKFSLMLEGGSIFTVEVELNWLNLEE